METRRLFKLGNSHVVTLPAPVLRALGWNQGDELEVRVKGQEVTFTNARQHDVAARIKSGVPPFIVRRNYR